MMNSVFQIPQAGAGAGGANPADLLAAIAAIPRTADRGDAAAADFTEATLTADNAFHDLDLSAIIPAGTPAVLLAVEYTSTSASQSIVFRKKGNTHAINEGELTTQVATKKVAADILVACDANRKIQYLITDPVPPTAINITVRGWLP